MKRIQIAKYSYILTSAAIILIGCFFLIRPETSLVTLSRAVGAVVLVSGLAKLFGYFSNDAHQIAFQFDLALGALTALFSIVILLFPEQFAKYLTMLVSIFVVTNALFTVQNAVEAKRFGIRKWWVLLIGAAAFLAGLAALLRPSETNLFLMRFVGIALILDGIQNIIVAAITIYRKKTK
ncbi:MAG: HdeD family acid-resistance protein [Acutalibacteraceae bacterium]